ncbi:MAG: DUF1523 family protein [Paracoccaceae bacterium]
MAYVRWTIRIVLLLMLGAFLHYTLPQRDIVRIVNTYEERQDFGGFGDLFWKNTRGATAESPATRDVLFIQTVKADGEVMVYRNQDTGFGWPPYFKFDTANLQTEASDAVSTVEAPKWVAMRHYGWRNTWLLGGIFPNGLSMKPVEGPDVQLIPWFNIVFLTVLAVILITIWRLWRNFRIRRIDPVLEDIDEAGDAARGRLTGFFDKFRSKR